MKVAAAVTIINLLCSTPSAYDDCDDDDKNKSDWAIPHDSNNRSIFINHRICVAVLARMPQHKHNFYAYLTIICQRTVDISKTLIVH
jgi:hypothetical protein